MKTVIEMAREAGMELYGLGKNRERFIYHLERFAELVRADERNSWPAEMEAMERQVNILTDALAQAKADERNRLATKLVQDFKGAFGDDTCASWAVWIRGQK